MNFWRSKGFVSFVGTQTTAFELPLTTNRSIKYYFMNFPKRIKQHKSQSDSFAILLYKLKDVGIFRNITENDYGIDFEIEMVLENQLVGRYLKAQVKSAEGLSYRKKDGVPTVGRIKQTTLNYWAELSYRSPVVVFIVDLKNEDIFFTESIFWQATRLIDGSQKTKTIEFLNINKLLELDDHSISQKIRKEVMKKFFSTLFIQKLAHESSITDIIYAHKTILRNIKSIFSFYTGVWSADPWCEIDSSDEFRNVLECSKILNIKIPSEELTQEQETNLFDFDYWVEITDWGYDEISNQVAMKPLKLIMPALLDKIQYYNKLILDGAYFWIHKDLSYLKLVYKTNIPTFREHEEIRTFSYKPTVYVTDDKFYLFIEEVLKKKV